MCSNLEFGLSSAVIRIVFTSIFPCSFNSFVAEFVRITKRTSAQHLFRTKRMESRRTSQSATNATQPGKSCKPVSAAGIVTVSSSTTGCLSATSTSKSIAGLLISTLKYENAPFLPLTIVVFLFLVKFQLQFQHRQCSKTKVTNCLLLIIIEFVPNYKRNELLLT